MFKWLEDLIYPEKEIERIMAQFVHNQGAIYDVFCLRLDRLEVDLHKLEKKISSYETKLSKKPKKTLRKNEANNIKSNTN